ncbi:MAG TPA: PAS domain S-box protein, partial [Prolixibacteraceae bacterium]
MNIAINDPDISEKRYRAMIENSEDAVVLLNAAGIIEYESPAYAKLMGRKESFRLGNACLEFIHPDDHAIYAEAFDKILNNPGLPVKFSLRNRHCNGNWLHLECIANNLLEESDICGIVVNIHDVTDHWNAREALRESESLYADLVLNQVA